MPACKRVLGIVLVDERRTVADRRRGVEDRREFLVDDLDGRGRSVGLFARFGRHGGDVIAGQTHFLERKHRPVGEHRTEADVADVGGGQHGVHAGHRFGRRSVDADDARVRVGEIANAAHSIPVRCRSAVNFASPLTFSRPSTRRSLPVRLPVSPSS